MNWNEMPLDATVLVSPEKWQDYCTVKHHVMDKTY